MLSPPMANGARTNAVVSLVQDDLAEVERVLEASLMPFRQRFGPIVDHLKHYRGKRLRPVLVLLTAHAVGRVTPAHHVLGAVVEMVHTATLVHDDVLDEASTRRHTATINAAWGTKTALLLGDMLFSAAFRLCSTVDAQSCTWIGDATNRVCAGELLQVSRAGDLHLSEADYFEIVCGKTGALTECCTRLGAHHAGAAPAVVDSLAAYGRDLGIAFQIADDILDLTGSDSTTGKTLGTDVGQGKMTLPLIRAMNALNIQDADRWRDQLRSGDVGDLQALLQQTGAIESASTEARRVATAARHALAVLPPSSHRVALESLCEWAIRRDQ